MRPVTQEQWQDAVDAAELLACLTTAKVLLLIEMGKLFGLINDNGEVDIAACQEVIEDAHEQGIVLSTGTIQQFLVEGN